MLCAGGTHARSSPEERSAAEVAALRDWAAQSGLILDPLDFLPFARKGGAEHMVWKAPGARWIKLTYHGEFGCTPELEWAFDPATEEAIQRPFLRIGTPLEYLDRLQLQNEVFGDDMRLLGIIDKRRGFHVVTGQPDIAVESLTGAEILAFNRSFGGRSPNLWNAATMEASRPHDKRSPLGLAWNFARAESSAAARGITMRRWIFHRT